MIHERDAVCEWEPIRMHDGRVYGVAFVQVSNHCDSPDVLWTCSVGVVQRGVEYSYWEFCFQFYESIFERGDVGEDADELSDFARAWIGHYFTEYHCARPQHTWGYPIWIECR